MPTEAKLGLVIGIILTIVIAVCFKPGETSAAKPLATYSTPASVVQGQTTGLRR
jgi:hypothetical protein